MGAAMVDQMHQPPHRRHRAHGGDAHLPTLFAGAKAHQFDHERIGQRCEARQSFRGGGMADGDARIIPLDMRAQQALRRTIGAHDPPLFHQHQRIGNPLQQGWEIGMVDQVGLFDRGGGQVGLRVVAMRRDQQHDQPGQDRQGDANRRSAKQQGAAGAQHKHGKRRGNLGNAESIHGYRTGFVAQTLRRPKPNSVQSLRFGKREMRNRTI